MMDGWGLAWDEHKDHQLYDGVGSVSKLVLLPMLHGNNSQCNPVGDTCIVFSFCGGRTLQLSHQFSYKIK